MWQPYRRSGPWHAFGISKIWKIAKQHKWIRLACCDIIKIKILSMFSDGRGVFCVNGRMRSQYLTVRWLKGHVKNMWTKAISCTVFDEFHSIFWFSAIRSVDKPFWYLCKNSESFNSGHILGFFLYDAFNQREVSTELARLFICIPL